MLCIPPGGEGESARTSWEEKRQKLPRDERGNGSKASQMQGEKGREGEVEKQGAHEECAL